jgi:hypothetical protein
MQVTQTVYLIAGPSQKYNQETYKYEDCVSFTVWPYDKYGDSVPAVASQEVTFEVPDGLNAKDLKLQALEAERVKLMADFNHRITQIQAEINQLTAIEFQVAPQGDDLDIPF